MSESAANRQTGLEIAVIGMNGRFPGARNIEEFWQNLRDGVESIVKFTDEEQIAAGVSPAVLKLSNYVNAGTVLEDPDLFDAAFFGYSPREAEIMDPQQRLFLECAWQVLEIAGYDADKYSGRIGVYGSISFNTYLLFYLSTNRDLVDSVGAFQTLIGNDKDFLTTRVSYKLNLHGPSINVQTACSSSLVAVHLACQSLIAGECDMALAGGVSLSVPQRAGSFYDEGGINSSDGHCRAFDEKADGTIDGNGVAIVVLKRLADALVDGDQIHAVIKGSAINNDGSDRVGFTAPSLKGQSAVIRDALIMAEVEAETITYVEAHGSATPLGDPIEVAALTRAFRDGTEKKGFCALGSVKTNVGHLDAAAGVTGLIKTVLALKHRQLPPSLHFTQPNPQIDFANSPFYVNARLREWTVPEGVPRRAGVSSFGLGGTNAHMILEEAPAVAPSGDSRPWQLLLLSAKTDSALEMTTANLVEHFGKNESQGSEASSQRLADVAYTLQLGRRSFEHRRMLVCRSVDDGRVALETQDPERILSGRHAAGQRPVVFMFPGLGDHYVNMGRGLYQTETTFREQVDLCSEQLKSYLGIDLREVLYPAALESAEAVSTTAGRGFDLRRMLYPEKAAEGSIAQKLNQTSMAQPGVFVLEYALARLLMEWGLSPQAMIGYSIGEYVAACLAGVFTLEEALLLLAQRAQMIQELPAGAMLAVPLSRTEVEPLLDGQLSLAATNGPAMCVVAGATDAIARLEKQLFEKDLVYRRLQTTHAFHSRMMEPSVAAFVELFKQVDPQPPRIPFISNVTGRWINDEQATDPAYWARHMCESVRFSEGLETLWQQPDPILLEVGPGQTLSSLVWSHPAKPADCTALTSVRHSYDPQPDSAFLLGALGQLWLAGAQIDWPGFYRHERRRRVSLPTYPFERKRYWLQSKRTPKPSAASQLSGDKKQDLGEWFYVPIWKQSAHPAQLKPSELATSVARWLVFADSCGIGSGLVEQLSRAGQEVVIVTAGERFSGPSANSYTINPRRVEDYDSLMKELNAQDQSPTDIVHLWSVTPDNERASLQDCDEIQAHGFYSLLHLAQSLSSREASAALNLWVVSNNMQSVSGRETLCPEKATALGPCKVIPLEYANINCRSIDINLPTGETSREQLLDSMLAEFAAKLPDEIIAYREARRWVQVFEQVRLEKRAEAPPCLRENGVYLITGGLGGIGLELAAYLAETTRAKLILIGRTVPPARDEWPDWLSTHDAADINSRKIRRLQTLEELGAEVMIASVDVADEEEMRKVIAEARERFGAIHGVIHAAGIAGGGIIQVKQPEAAAAVLAPKVKGTLVLDALLGEEKLDFVLLCSALASVLGGPAQVDYTGANAFLDAFAHRKASQNRPWTVTVNWDIWREVGLAVNTAVPLEFKEMRQREVEAGMSSKEGVEVFHRILHSRLSQAVVSMQDFEFLRQQSRNFNAGAYLEQLENTRQAEPAHPRPQLGNPYVAPRNETEEIIAGVWKHLLGIEQVGVHDNFLQLGGHSLLATQVCSHLREIFQVELPLRRFFERPTVAGLAEATTLEKSEQTKTEVPALHKSPRGDKDVEQLLFELEQLSHEEVEALLAAESPLTERRN